MKCFLTIFFLLISLSCISQDSSWSWKVSSTRLNNAAYHIVVKGKVPQGWHIYAQEDTDNGIETLQINPDNEEIQKDGSLLNDVSPTIISDRLFGKKLKVYSGEFSLLQAIKVIGKIPAAIRINISGYASNNSEFLPIDITKEVTLEGGIALNQNLKLASVDLDKPAAGCGDVKDNAGKSLLAIFLLGVAGGLLALLTPCVFPMIPVTVSYFTSIGKTKKQGTRNGFVYGLSIFFIYLLASVPFHLIGNINPQIFNTVSTNAWVNIFFFAIFIFFALSFFGVFNLKLPSAIANSAGSKGGIFFMALTLAIVSFSCTGPILGSLLVGSLSSEGGAWQLTAGMAGFGVALALPFALFAMFPNWLKTLPKSGGWMETVKVSLAFVELALAVKFLSNADLVKHWGILKREVFIGLWIIIAVAMSLYLFGLFGKKYKLKVAVERNRLTGRNFIACIVLLFAIYLVPGVTQSKFANLTLLSGFPPPLSYSIYGTDNIKGKGVEPAVINDYDKALQMSKEQNKPILIDFTGWACVNCRKMEEHVWSKPEIAQLINDKFILVSLYVDDRKKLPASDQFVFKNKNGEKDIKTVGDKWATFQQENFNQVTQPLYVVLSPDERLMNNPVGYTPSAEEYKGWLQCGIEAFKRQKEIVVK